MNKPTIRKKDPRNRPLLRGVSHLLAFLLSLYTGWIMYKSAPPGTENVVFLYVCSISFCFGASGFLHVITWSPKYYRIMRQIDHSMVFLLIACTYNIISILPEGGTVIIWIGWIGATFGILFKVFFFEQSENGPKAITSLPYVILGWSSLLELQRINYYITFCGWEGILLCVLGGIAVTIGALCYTNKSPNPLPGIFGHHEILHLSVIAAIYCFFFCVQFILDTYSNVVLQNDEKFVY